MHKIERITLKTNSYQLNIPKSKAITSDGNRYKLRIQSPKNEERIFSCSISNGFTRPLVRHIQTVFTDMLYSIDAGFGIQKEHDMLLAQLNEYFPKLHRKLLEHYTEINQTTPTLRALIEQYKSVYLNRNEQDRDPGRRGTDPSKSVNARCEALIRLLGEDTNPLAITKDKVIKRFQKAYTEPKQTRNKELHKRRNAPSITENTAKTYLSTLLTIFRTCTTYPSNYLPYNPLEGMTTKDLPPKHKKGKKKNNQEVEYLDENQRKDFFKAMAQEMRCTTEEQRLMVRAITALAIFKPFRANEVKDMKWEDIDFDEEKGVYYINFKINSKHKPVFYRKIPIIWTEFNDILTDWWDYCKAKSTYSINDRVWHLWSDDQKTFAGSMRTAVLNRLTKWNKVNTPIMQAFFPSPENDDEEKQRGLHYLRGCGMYWNLLNGVTVSMLSNMVGTTPTIIERSYLRSKKQKEIDLQRNLLVLRESQTTPSHPQAFQDVQQATKGVT